MGISVCPDCALSLIPERPMQGEAETQEDEALVTIATFENAVEAAVARGALEAEGILAFFADENVGAFARTGTHEAWPELKVRASDRDRAVEFLKQAGHQ